MDNYEKWGYLLLSVIVVIYLVTISIWIVTTFTFGLIGLFLIVGIGILMIKVTKERLKNKEDDYYSKEVDK